MSEINHESKLDPYIVIAQERIRALALGVCSVGSNVNGEYMLSLPQVSVGDIDRCLGQTGLGQLAAIISPSMDPFAKAGVVELFAKTVENPMFVVDKVNFHNPDGEIPIFGQTSWSASLGFIIPYFGTYDNGNEYILHHKITVSTESSDMLPAISSLLDVQVHTDAVTSFSEALQDETLMTAFQSIDLIDEASKFYDRAIQRKH